ncbi:MAG: transposase [Planctomycetaceae bacterium]|nr:transposase [Planctomycetaceae bacterium]
MSRGKSAGSEAGEPRRRRRFTEEFKAEAVQMLLDGHTASSICERLGLSGPNVLYRWKRELVRRGGSTAVGLEARVRELEAELRRVERERDILKKALSIFGRDG